MKRQLFAILAAAAAVTASLLVSSGAAAAVPDPTTASAQGGGTPSNPKDSLIYVDPTRYKIVASLRGVGKQVYDCPTAGGTYAFREPIAGLFTSRGIPAAIHGKGPTNGPFWANFDGSHVDGSLLETLASPGGDTNIPWLKLKGAPPTNANTTGVFSNVEIIQRVDTRGGVAPKPAGGCTFPSTVAVDYTANYVFWASNPK